MRAPTFKMLHTPPAVPVGYPAADYALGWAVRTVGTRCVIWHNGSNTLWYAMLAFDPDADLGVVIVTNSSIAAQAKVDLTAMAFLAARR